MERDKTPIVLTSTEEDKAWTGHNNGTKAWYVSFQTDEAWQLEEWISGKQDWDGVKLRSRTRSIPRRATTRRPCRPGPVAAWCRMGLNPTYLIINLMS